MTQDPLEIYAAVVATVGLIIALITFILSTYNPNKLEFSLKYPPFEDAIVVNVSPQITDRFFHIVVNNKHKKRMALNCKPYLVSLRKKSDGKELVGVPIPLKWRGLPAQIADIGPRGEARLDAFHINIGNPIPITFNAFIDSSALIPIVNFPGEYEAIYRVTSDNFKMKEESFIITLSVKALEVDFRQKSGERK